MNLTLHRRDAVVRFVTASPGDFTPGQVAEANGVTLRTVNDCIRHGRLEVNSDGCLVPAAPPTEDIWGRPGLPVSAVTCDERQG